MKKKSVWKKWWFWGVIILFVSINLIITQLSEQKSTPEEPRSIHSNIPSH